MTSHISTSHEELTIQMSLNILKRLNQFINCHAGKLLLLGLARYAWRFYAQWQEDQNNLAQKQPPAPLPPLEEWVELPLVTLLVAAWNEEAYIEGFLSSFADLDYPNKELILVAGGSDQTFSKAHPWASPQLTILEQQAGEGKHRALQRGFQFASGTVIYLTDADCHLNSEGFRRAIYPIITGSESVVTGLSRPFAHQLSNPFVRAQLIRQQLGEILPNRKPYVPFILGRNAALARFHLEGGWPTFPKPARWNRLLRCPIRAERWSQNITSSRKATSKHALPNRLPNTSGKKAAGIVVR